MQKLKLNNPFSQWFPHPQTISTLHSVMHFVNYTIRSLLFPSPFRRLPNFSKISLEYKRFIFVISQFALYLIYLAAKAHLLEYIISILFYSYLSVMMCMLSVLRQPVECSTTSFLNMWTRTELLDIHCSLMQWTSYTLSSYFGTPHKRFICFRAIIPIRARRCRNNVAHKQYSQKFSIPRSKLYRDSNVSRKLPASRNIHGVSITFHKK